MARLGGLPLLHQPGEQWMYHTGSDALGVLISRATGVSLGEFLEERIFAPLGMKDTGFSVPEEKIDRLATAYKTDQTGKLAVYDPAGVGQWSRPPKFESGGGGLVSTADDYLTFGRMMINRGTLGSIRLLARPTVELMMSDQITPEQKARSPFFPGFWDQRLGIRGVGGHTARCRRPSGGQLRLDRRIGYRLVRRPGGRDGQRSFVSADDDVAG